MNKVLPGIIAASIFTMMFGLATGTQTGALAYAIVGGTTLLIASLAYKATKDADRGNAQ